MSEKRIEKGHDVPKPPPSTPKITEAKAGWIVPAKPKPPKK